MIVLALVVGALTAWYLGIRTGVFAAIAAALALLVAMFVPGTALPVYVLLGLWCAGLWFFKTKLASLGRPKEPEKKGWEKELDRWKKRAGALWKMARK
jgi:hypothetical protein